MDFAKKTIEKVKLKNSQLDVNYEERFTEENYSNDIMKKCSQIIHSDLAKALDMLKPHLVYICEMPEAEILKEVGLYDFNIERLDNYVITGYSHGGSDESSGIVIIGQKLLQSGKVLNLTTPFIQFADDEAYPFCQELKEDINTCDSEVYDYLFNQKWGVKQMNLDFDMPDDVNLEVEVKEVEKPKRKRKKKEPELAEIA